MNKTIWIVVGVIAIVAVLFAGLLPLPGQKDNVTVHTQPAPPGESPRPTAPKGPPTDSPINPGQQPK